ncbi:LTA synthase family protein [Lacticaseibacillus nasuensis]|uniref:LTA synthase family protein n=2 Tax=Lacticaseibacillus nasuensis TaxID=944671 RepID=UPI000704A547|nr:LTA synthase family protein [Lacticaseibacillus nasuensis]
MQGQRQTWVTRGINSVIILGIIFTQLIMGSGRMWMAAIGGTHLTLLWLAGALLYYGTLVMLVVGILWWLLALGTRPIAFKRVAQAWLTIVVTGVGIVATGIATNSINSVQTIYDVVMPITRQALPLVTGLIAFLLLQPGLIRLAKNKGFSRLVWGLLAINIVFGRDGLGFGSGATVTGVILLGALALTLAPATHYRRSIGVTLASGVIGYATIIIMAWLRVSREASIDVAFRFVTALSPLTVLPAVGIVSLLLAWRGGQSDQPNEEMPSSVTNWGIFVALFLTTQPSVVGLFRWLLTLMRVRIFNWCGGLWVVPAAISISLLVFIGAWLVWQIVMRLPWWQAMGRWREGDLLTFANQLMPQWLQALKKFWHVSWPAVVAGLTLFVVQCSSTMLLHLSFKFVEKWGSGNQNIFSSVIFGGPSIMIAGTLVLLMAFWVLRGLTGRYWLSLVLVSAATLVFGVANRLKIENRSEPVVPSDIAELTGIQELLGMVNRGVVIATVIGLVLLIGVIIWLERRHQVQAPVWWWRITTVVIGLAFLAGSAYMHVARSPLTRFYQVLGIQPDSNKDILYYAQKEGPVTFFLSQLNVPTMDQPTGYSEAAIKALVTKYDKTAQVLNRQRTTASNQLTVLFNLSESFATPTRLAGVTLNQNPIPNITQLRQHATSGSMMSFGYGGGTANMEYMSLTGMSMGLFSSSTLVPNTQVVPAEKIAPNVGDWFDYASAIHPYKGAFYNRIGVYKKYQFNKFVYLGSADKIIDQKRIGTSPYLSDETAYANALNQIKSRQGGQFINLITMQNHMPFTQDTYPDHQFKASGKLVNSSNRFEVEHYSQGIHYTDTDVKRFVAQLDRINKPIIWVFYGDHLPAIYNLPTSVDKYATDYFIYANRYARDHGAQQKMTTNTNYVGTNDFIAMALAQGNAKVDAYGALLTKVQQELPTVWFPGTNAQGKQVPQFVNEQGKLIPLTKLTKRQRVLFHDYQLLQYDITAGKQYALKAGVMKTVKK